jgi:hypothetical protein
MSFIKIMQNNNLLFTIYCLAVTALAVGKILNFKLLITK